MKCEVVATGTQVRIIRIGLPDDRHSEHSPIKIDCTRYVSDIERQMSQSAMLYHSTCNLQLVLRVIAASILSPAVRRPLTTASFYSRPPPILGPMERRRAGCGRSVRYSQMSALQQSSV